MTSVTEILEERKQLIVCRGLRLCTENYRELRFDLKHDEQTIVNHLDTINGNIPAATTRLDECANADRRRANNTSGIAHRVKHGRSGAQLRGAEACNQRLLADDTVVVSGCSLTRFDQKMVTIHPVARDLNR